MNRLLTAIAAGCLLTLPARTAGKLKVYQSRFYTIHSDMPREVVQEAMLRLDAMAVEYANRLRGFAPRSARRMDFYLFRNAEDYYRAGGLPGSAGVYTGQKLMAIGGERISEGLWHVLQHEGLHQFLHQVIHGDIPVWVNEGLAEYFGEAIFVGDGFVTGIVRPERLRRVQALIRGNQVLSIAEMMQMSHDKWNALLRGRNYDQAWSMIQFLAHGDGGRYQGPFNRFLADLAHGARWEHAWQRNFGTGTAAFERRWRQYWLNMTEADTVPRRAEAVLHIVTAFYARAFSQKQHYPQWEDFVAAARAGRLRQNPRDWLPPSLLASALAQAPKLGRWQIRRRQGYEIVCTLADRRQLAGSFRVRNGRVVPGSIRIRLSTRRRNGRP